MAGAPLAIGASVGVAHLEDHQTRDDLIHAADLALQELRRGRTARRSATSP